MTKQFTTSASPTQVPGSPTVSAWRTQLDSKLSPDSSNMSTPAVLTSPTSASGNSTSRPVQRPFITEVHLNPLNQKVDIPSILHPDWKTIKAITSRDHKLCRAHHLLGRCPVGNCPFHETSVLSTKKHHALLYSVRQWPCSRGGACRSASCFRGHMCPRGSDCPQGEKCQFVDKHDIDTRVVKKTVDRTNLGTDIGKEVSMSCTVW